MIYIKRKVYQKIARIANKAYYWAIDNYFRSHDEYWDKKEMGYK